MNESKIAYNTSQSNSSIVLSVQSILTILIYLVLALWIELKFDKKETSADETYTKTFHF